MSAHRRFVRPLLSARSLVGHRRSTRNDLRLGTILAVVAGAANAGGFFALGQYTSHMTGYLSGVADNVVLGNLVTAGAAALLISTFIAGAAVSTYLINWARLRMSRKQYALPLAAQGFLLACLSAVAALPVPIGRLFALYCLCFIMGMQNATITKISSARIRTTHATGMITDVGIECGRAAFSLLHPAGTVRLDMNKLRIHLSLIGAFVVGGVAGAVGYSRMGYLFSLPLALILFALAMPALMSGTNQHVPR